LERLENWNVGVNTTSELAKRENKDDKKPKRKNMTGVQAVN